MQRSQGAVVTEHTMALLCIVLLTSACLLPTGKMVETAHDAGKSGTGTTEMVRQPSTDGGSAEGDPRDAGGNRSTGSEMAKGSHGDVDGGTTSGASDPCASSVCSVDYPCRGLSGGGYTCRGQFADWPPAYDAAAFKNNGDDTVSDIRSGLVWQRSVPSSYAPVCSGQYKASNGAAGDACSWEDAKKYCTGLSLAGTGWRLPTKAELESIVDISRQTPAIDPIVFPSTPPDIFWSSSPHSGSSGGEWVVVFDDGNSTNGGSTPAARVRCVR